MKELINLTMDEQMQYQVIKNSLEGKIKVKSASLILGLCIRHIYRLSQKVKQEKGVIHHSRGEESARRITEEKIKQLYRDKYSGFNIIHFTEHLNNNEDILISGGESETNIKVRKSLCQETSKT